MIVVKVLEPFTFIEPDNPNEPVIVWESEISSPSLTLPDAVNSLVDMLFTENVLPVIVPEALMLLPVILMDVKEVNPDIEDVVSPNERVVVPIVNELVTSEPLNTPLPLSYSRLIPDEPAVSTTERVFLEPDIKCSEPVSNDIVPVVVIVPPLNPSPEIIDITPPPPPPIEIAPLLPPESATSNKLTSLPS